MRIPHLTLLFSMKPPDGFVTAARGIFMPGCKSHSKKAREFQQVSGRNSHKKPKRWVCPTHFTAQKIETANFPPWEFRGKNMHVKRFISSNFRAFCTGFRTIGKVQKRLFLSEKFKKFAEKSSPLRKRAGNVHGGSGGIRTRDVELKAVLLQQVSNCRGNSVGIQSPKYAGQCLQDTCGITC